ncbi:MAG: hypothetical protein B7Z55_07655 [Planctomycetales bacterium 12-60-4]|nr:MAG: hypothetical protein B7Z55_07655 [Planctomycetales bacterium 12-60-4]
MLDSLTIELATIVGLVGGMLLATELCYRAGRWQAQRTTADKAQLGTIQGAILALLGLLLGFSFSGAATRFVDRQDHIVEEANAIGTAYLRADLLPPAHRDALQDCLRRYATSRVRWFVDYTPARYPELASETASLHNEMWQAALAGIQETPQFAVTVLPPINDVIDLHTSRIAAGRRHMLVLIVVMLFICALIAMATVGYGCGLDGHRATTLTSALCLLVATVLWITIDLDYPRDGLIRIDQQPILEALESLGN